MISSTFVCPTEIVSFSDRIKEFHALNAEVVGVSVDSHFSHLAWCNIDRKVYFTITYLIMYNEYNKSITQYRMVVLDY